MTRTNVFVRNEMVRSLRELLNEKGLQVEDVFSSDLVLSGALKGVMKALMRSGSKVALRAGLADYVDQIRVLDSFGLGEKSVKHSAVIATALSLLKTGVPSELVKKYVTEFVRLKSGDKLDLMKCTIGIELRAEKAFLTMQAKTKSTTSEGAVAAMLPSYLHDFTYVFCKEVANSTQPAKLVRMAATQLKNAA